MKRILFLSLLATLLLMAALPILAQTQDDGAASPVPEPGTIVMMGAGLAFVAYAGWRRNRKK